MEWQRWVGSLNCCNTLQHTAPNCKSLQHTATYSQRGWQRWVGSLNCCNTLQHTAPNCNTLQHTATYSQRGWQRWVGSLNRCHTLQHTTSLCNTFWMNTTISRLPKLRSLFWKQHYCYRAFLQKSPLYVGLFCKRALQKQDYLSCVLENRLQGGEVA